MKTLNEYLNAISKRGDRYPSRWQSLLPGYGDMYYQILDKQYISRFPLTEPEISEMLNIERSVFYDRKKEALYLFGICLFGYTLPEVRQLFTD